MTRISDNNRKLFQTTFPNIKFNFIFKSPWILGLNEILAKFLSHLTKKVTSTLIIF